MRIIALLLVAIVALGHVGFLVLEMFYWTDPIGQRIFETTPEVAASAVSNDTAPARCSTSPPACRTRPKRWKTPSNSTCSVPSAGIG